MKVIACPNTRIQLNHLHRICWYHAPMYIPRPTLWCTIIEGTWEDN